MSFPNNEIMKIKQALFNSLSMNN